MTRKRFRSTVISSLTVTASSRLTSTATAMWIKRTLGLSNGAWARSIPLPHRSVRADRRNGIELD